MDVLTSLDRYFGTLTIIIYTMLFKDVFRFMVVFALLLAGFAQCFAIIHAPKDELSLQGEPEHTLNHAIFQFFLFAVGELGDAGPERFRNASEGVTATCYVIFLVFIVLCRAGIAARRGGERGHTSLPSPPPPHTLAHGLPPLPSPLLRPHTFSSLPWEWRAVTR